MFEQLRKMRYGVQMRLREVHKVTEWRDGCVYRTKSLGYIVCNHDYRLPGVQIGSVSTRITRMFAEQK